MQQSEQRLHIVDFTSAMLLCKTFKVPLTLLNFLCLTLLVVLGLWCIDGVTDLVLHLLFSPRQACEKLPPQRLCRVSITKTLLWVFFHVKVHFVRSQEPVALPALHLNYSVSDVYSRTLFLQHPVNMVVSAVTDVETAGGTVHHFKPHLTLYRALFLKPKLLTAERQCSSRHSLA